MCVMRWLFCLSIVLNFWYYFGGTARIDYPDRELCEGVSGTGCDYQHIEHLFGTYRLGRGNIVQYRPAGQFKEPCRVRLRRAEARVERIGVMGHYGGNFAARSGKALHLLKNAGEGAERPAHRKSHPKSRKLLYIVHRVYPFRSKAPLIAPDTVKLCAVCSGSAKRRGQANPGALRGSYRR